MIIFSQVILYAGQLFQTFHFYVLLSLNHQKFPIKGISLAMELGKKTRKMLASWFSVKGTRIKD